ncbi:MAG: DUF896 domain-containing protein [Candidatus Sericytochromatia bacterium]|nr:DUF896 domain-containing protein [Candidatus Sericytochromatia bacterium]
MAVNDEQVARINFLARKAKAEGLSLEERQEQISLRQAYVAAVRENLTGILETITVVDPEDVGATPEGITAETIIVINPEDEAASPEGIPIENTVLFISETAKVPIEPPREADS